MIQVDTFYLFEEVLLWKTMSKRWKLRWLLETDEGLMHFSLTIFTLLVSGECVAEKKQFVP